jgi:hypothetical protein
LSKYRRLALAEPDHQKAALLQMLADEAERGVLATSEWISAESEERRLSPVPEKNPLA